MEVMCHFCLPCQNHLGALYNCAGLSVSSTKIIDIFLKSIYEALGPLPGRGNRSVFLVIFPL